MTVTLMEEKQRGWIKQLKDKRRRGEMNERKGKKTVLRFSDIKTLKTLIKNKSHLSENHPSVRSSREPLMN